MELVIDEEILIPSALARRGAITAGPHGSLGEAPPMAEAGITAGPHGSLGEPASTAPLADEADDDDEDDEIGVPKIDPTYFIDLKTGLIDP